MVFIALGYCITFSSSGQAAAVSSKAAFWSNSEAYVFLNGKKSYVSKKKQCIGFLKNNCPNCLDRLEYSTLVGKAGGNLTVKNLTISFTRLPRLGVDDDDGKVVVVVVEVLERKTRALILSPGV